MGAPHSRCLAALLVSWAVLLLWVWPGSVAWAGPEVNIPRAEDGPGVKVGQRSTLHPGAALVVGVDTNVFSEDRAEDPRAATLLMPTAWLGVGNRKFRDGLLMSPPERTGRNADYYIGAIAGFRQYLAANPNVRSQSRFTGGLTLRLSLLPGRKFSAQLDNDTFYYSQPASYEAQAGYNFNRLDQKMQLSFIGRPGGGRFSILLGLRNQDLIFTNASSEFSDIQIYRGSRTVNGFVNELKWRFFPKSGIFFRYSMDWTYYLLCCSATDEARNEDNFAHRILAGYRGQLRKKVVFNAMGGLGLGFYRDDVNGPNFRGPIFDLTLGYYPNPRSEIRFGLYRSFNDSLFGNYYTDIGGRLKAQYEFKWRMLAVGSLWVAGRQYAGLPVPGVEINCEAIQGAGPDIGDPACITGYRGTGADLFQRRDTIFGLLAKLEQPLGRLFAVSLQYDLAVDSTNFEISYRIVRRNPDSDAREPQFFEPVTDFAGFTRHVIMLFGAVRL